MKNLLFLLVITLTACGERTLTPAEKRERQKFIDNYMDTAGASITKRVMFDTVGVSTAPVKVIKYGIVQREYSRYKDVAATYKNVSTKKIEGIRFRWYVENAFGEPADMGMEKGFGGGFDDDGLRPGRVESAEWSALSRDAKKIIKIWPIEVVFSDGTKWQSKNNP